MEDLDRILDRFTDPKTGSLHGAAFTAVDESGNIIYEKAAGRTSSDSHGASPLQIDSLYWIASMTKLATAVAVVQLVERGIVSLDDDVREKVPELRDIQVLQDMKPDQSKGSVQPEFHSAQGKITLRHLLCHTAGFIYDSSSPLLQQWSKYQGRKAYTFSGSMDGYNHPLVFEPGTAWGYGGGVDWAGQLVERVTGSTLEEFMQTNIWSKLGATSTTFHPELRPDNTLPPLLEMGNREVTKEGTKSVKPGKIILGQPLQDDLGGIGLFSTPADYTKLLSTLLRGGDPLLTNAGVDLLFRPQLDDVTRTSMPKSLGKQMRRILGVRAVDDNAQADYCLGGTITLKDIPNRRQKETVSWSGLPNLHWWIDRRTGIAAALFTQLLPPADEAATDLVIELETALYGGINGRSGRPSGNTKAKI